MNRAKYSKRIRQISIVKKDKLNHHFFVLLGGVD